MRIPATPSLLRPLALSAVMSVCAIAFAQAQEPTAPDSTRFQLRPSFSLGTGMLGFYGDVGFNSKHYSPLVSRIGYELRASSPITDWLEVSLFALHGRLSANERSLGRNLNFESRITTGGVQFTYTFNQLLKPGHRSQTVGLRL